jgi:2-amino-4-hydroxy-6-hydroxymethyldihydropteridine diphosphokinase
MTEPRGRVQAVIGFSANLGDRTRTLERAVRALDAAEGVRVRRVSPWFETEPVGGPPGQPRYLNGVAEIATTLSARALLDLMLAIERANGRVRSDVRNGPRTLDLDLLFFGAERIVEPGLVVPHPRLEERLFVLEPLAALEPNRLLAGCGCTVRQRVDALYARRCEP